MQDNHAENHRWAGLALDYARRIAQLSPGRGSATQAERRAAEEVKGILLKKGIHDLQVQEFTGLRSFWLFIALAFGMALTGHAAFWLLTRPTGMIASLVICLSLFAFSGYLLWRKFTFRAYPLQMSLPHGPSQNVLAKVAPAQAARRQVVLVAHLDSHRAVWWFASDFLTRAMSMLTPAGIYGVFMAPFLYLLADLSGWMIFAYLALGLAGLHFIAWFTGVTADLGVYSPGANDNASAVGSVLALAERLLQQPLQHTEVWLAFTGCEETGCDGMRAMLEKYGEELHDALFLDFELVGIGDQLAYLQSEGVIRPRRIPPELEQLVLRVGQDFAIQPLRAAQFGAFTETGVLWERGHHGACVLMLRQGAMLLPEWHRLTDRSERLEAGALEKAHQFAWKFLLTIDQDASETPAVQQAT